ncbi:hypothetical protein SpCBS45565_g07808 [Spizellomyces sp. 'palustris']|nr:hypothetical protein SpCBS45565_g07808 [Spizellomyces sp. 'palustris']
MTIDPPAKRVKTDLECEMSCTIPTSIAEKVPIVYTLDPFFLQEAPVQPPLNVDNVSDELITALETLSTALSEYIQSSCSTIEREAALINAPELTHSVHVLRAEGFQSLISEYYFVNVQDHFYKTVTTHLQNFEMDYSTLNNEDVEDADYSEWCWKEYTSLVTRLAGYMNAYTCGFDLLGNIDGTFHTRLYNFFEGHLRRSLPSCWQDVTTRIFEHSLQKYDAFLSNEDSMEDLERELDSLPELMSRLRSIGVLSESTSALMLVARERVKRKVEECRGQYEEPALAECIQWVEQHLCGGWLQRIVQYENSTTNLKFENWCRDLTVWTSREFCSMRLHEIFDIVRNYAFGLTSEATLTDLKHCLTTSVQKEELVKSLRAGIEERALHAGVATEDIITILVATENTLRVIDPTSNLLLKTIGPMKEYLRRRPDTVQHILSRMLDEDSELAEAMRQGDSVRDAEGADDVYDNWEPEPVDAVGTRQERAADIITRLISICESKDAFVHEYHKMLLDCLIHKLDYETDKETLEVELLKTRFEEASFNQCEIMLMDMATSRRLDHQLYSKAGTDETMETESNPAPLHTTIMSHLFWPPLDTTDFSLPPEIERAKRTYEKHFEEQKPNRKLAWRPNAGIVEIELQMEDRMETLTVTELQATVIHLFGEQSPLTWDEIVAKLRAPNSPEDFKEDVGDCLSFWMSRGILKQLDEETYAVIETAGEDINNGPSIPMPTSRRNEEDRARAKQAAELRTKFQPMIMAMLTNQGPGTVERIKNLLTMFFQFSHTQNELQTLLDQLVSEGLLLVGRNREYSART